MTATIVVLRAFNLPRTDGIGKIDPYFILKHGFTRQKTRIFQDNLNPVYNESFTFQVRPGQPTNISVELWDEVCLLLF
jgi:Ca2+-dependent lipid-binding protein